jgi:uncharacterized repeat protein (TIGR04076 family)
VTTFKITVLKRMANQDLLDKLGEINLPIPCPAFADGQEFVLEEDREPENFCSGAWHDIHKSYLILKHGGRLGMMRRDDTIIACCSDGLRPVVFEIRKIGN